VAVLFVVVILDGIGMFLAYQASRDVARTAAQQAAIEYVSTGGNLGAAQGAAAAYARSKNVELLRIDLHTTQEKWFEAQARAQARTYLFRYVPLLQRWVDQTAVSVVRF
jgi:hypothetical protein